ncbi:hypothetical protein FF38_12990 [Lucilia cuprina]|uniref:Uncharacterized protein n=2 Tax=Lucilia cuprina TaxID=7375 RepID=A0A0L0CGG6_LUCCU|nr:hypothetical protein FF38_12990 [Lucilia cuprina]
MDLEKPQLILSYATRINAEQAVLRGKTFKDKRLQIAWAPVVQTPTAATTAASGNKTTTPSVENKTTGTDPVNFSNLPSPTYPTASNETDANNTDTLPELRLEDEEEDEESEDRSWRR